MHFRLLFFGLAITSGACQPAEKRASKAAPSSEAEQIVQRMVEAFNRHDLEGFVAEHAQNLQVYRFPDQLLTDSPEKFRAHYKQLFADEPNLRVTISPRIVHGRFVVDRETVMGLKSGTPDSALWIYEVKGGKIARAWAVELEEGKAD
jgi:hypothetical protein